jgi:hypothetical protein
MLLISSSGKYYLHTDTIHKAVENPKGAGGRGGENVAEAKSYAAQWISRNSG